ncbi:Conserved oligomeric Golgi complex subunit 6 [Sphaceloma murrayae]|uniref:Conserved oligomeric Golgi complex subunit 6 n=1 Tax=Sphaceloma murrayae TaxID=2082308 RepID=A0A2K1QHH3_9PEZI|nr:Conserved oligomeric Golgi complex subunit 6 [Sphaceloma murrayae]
MSASYFAADRKPSSGAPSPLFSPPAVGTPGSPAPSRANALQTRVATILSASYADLEISDALQTLDARGVKNTAETRRNLRLDLQQELIACNGEVVKDFGNVAEQLRRVGTALDSLNTTCSTIRAHVNAARKETGPMLDENRTLQSQRREAEMKQRLLSAFKAHFILEEQELNALTSTAEPVNDAFYQALTRIKQIHSDSQVLLGGENQTLGLEILETSSRHINAAYQKLFRWTQRSLKTLDLENPQLSTPLRHAFRVLAERPQLFQTCLDVFADSRERILSDAFYAALTGADAPAALSSSVPSKAIELSAHEPLRYVSDMLAWTHAATVGEREALANLFISDADAISASLRAGRASQPWLLQSDDRATDEGEVVFDGKRALSQLVDRDLAGVTRQLRQRIEQTVRSHDDALLAYQVANLCAFYDGIFVPLLGTESTVSSVLGPMADMAMEQFRLVTRDRIAGLRGEIEAVGDELGPPDWLEEALEVLRKLMKSYEGSFTGTVGREEKEKGFEGVVKEALDPYLEGIENVGRRLEGLERVVFGLNCFGRVVESLRGSAYVRARIEKIERLMEGLEESVTDKMRDWMEQQSGMRALFALVNSAHDDGEAISLEKLKGSAVFQHDALGEVAQQLDGFLPTSMEEARSHIGKLRDRAMAREICEEAADDFVESFEKLEKILEALDEDLVTGEDGESDGEVVSRRDVFPRTADEIRVLLS